MHIEAEYHPPTVGGNYFVVPLNLRLRDDLPGVPQMQHNLRALSAFVLAAQAALNLFSHANDGRHGAPIEAKQLLEQAHNGLDSFIQTNFEPVAQPLRKILQSLFKDVLDHLEFAQDMLFRSADISLALSTDITRESWPRLNSFVQNRINEAISVTAQFAAKPWARD